MHEPLLKPPTANLQNTKTKTQVLWENTTSKTNHEAHKRSKPLAANLPIPLNTFPLTRNPKPHPLPRHLYLQPAPQQNPPTVSTF